MIISHRYEFIFIKTRKTAGTSLEIALSGVCGEQDVLTPLREEDERMRIEWSGRGAQNYELPLGRYRPRDWARLAMHGRRAELTSHSSADRARRAVGREAWNSYTKFAVERNPYDRLFSLYAWDTRRAVPAPSIAEFLQTCDRDRLSNYPLYSIAGIVAVDRVLRYEELDSQLWDLWRDLNLPGEPVLPRAKAGVRKEYALGGPSLSNSESELIATACSREIKTFGYGPSPGDG
jgi:hypothetical protein